MGRSVAERLSRPVVEQALHVFDVGRRHQAQVQTLREELREQAVGLLVQAPFPRMVRPGEADVQAREDR